MKATRKLIPWLVTGRDFRRYTYRAVRECCRGRAIFFTYRFKNEKQSSLFVLMRYPVPEDERQHASASFAAGHFRKVRLEKLPAIRPMRSLSKERCRR